MELTKSVAAVVVRRASNRLSQDQVFTWGPARIHVERLESRRLLAAWTLQPDFAAIGLDVAPTQVTYVLDQWGYRWQGTQEDGSTVEGYDFKPVLDQNIAGEATSLETFLADFTAKLQTDAIASTGDTEVAFDSYAGSTNYDDEGSPIGDPVVGFFGNGGAEALEEIPTDDIDPVIMYSMAGDSGEGDPWIVTPDETLVQQTTVYLADFDNAGVTELTIDGDGVVTALADGASKSVTIDADTCEILVDGLATGYRTVRGRETGFGIEALDIGEWQFETTDLDGPIYYFASGGMGGEVAPTDGFAFESFMISARADSTASVVVSPSVFGQIFKNRDEVLDAADEAVIN